MAVKLVARTRVVQGNDPDNPNDVSVFEDKDEFEVELDVDAKRLVRAGAAECKSAADAKRLGLD
jgi:hypothetical protein